MDRKITLNDNINTADGKLNISHANPFFRTQVIAGYDHYVDEMGVNRFGEVVFEDENMTLLGGSIFTLEKLFGVRASTLTVSQIADYFDDNGMQKPTGWTSVTDEPLTADNLVCLFAVGTGGAGDSIGSVNDVKYYQRNIESIVPLRQIGADDELTADQHAQYFGRVQTGGIISYYFKKFDNIEIKCKWRDSDHEAEGSDVDDDYYDTAPSVTTPIETFVELTLKITRDDIREYFENNTKIELARINTVGLFTGVPVELASPIIVSGDITREYEYDQITCFSCLNFDNEPLSLPKELTIIYRIFTK